MSYSDGARVRTWTFAGTRQNRLLARQASTGAEKIGFDAFCIQAPVSQPDYQLLSERIDLTAAEFLAFRESIKFSVCVPPFLLTKTIISRNFEYVGDWGRAQFRENPDTNNTR